MTDNSYLYEYFLNNSDKEENEEEDTDCECEESIK